MRPLALLIVVIAAGLAGCGGDDEEPRATPTPRGVATPEGPTLVEWADDFCAVVVEFESAVAVATPSSELPFEQRKPQAIANFELFASATDRAVTGFSAIEPPAIAEPVHRAARGQFAAIRDAYKAALVPLREAATDDDIEAVNDQLRIDRDAAQQEYQAQVALASPAVATALGGVECGGFAG